MCGSPSWSRWSIHSLCRKNKGNPYWNKNQWGWSSTNTWRPPLQQSLLLEFVFSSESLSTSPFLLEKGRTGQLQILSLLDVSHFFKVANTPFFPTVTGWVPGTFYRDLWGHGFTPGETMNPQMPRKIEDGKRNKNRSRSRSRQRSPPPKRDRPGQGVCFATWQDGWNLKMQDVCTNFWEIFCWASKFGVIFEAGNLFCKLIDFSFGKSRSVNSVEGNTLFRCRKPNWFRQKSCWRCRHEVRINVYSEQKKTLQKRVEKSVVGRHLACGQCELFARTMRFSQMFCWRAEKLQR